MLFLYSDPSPPAFPLLSFPRITCFAYANGLFFYRPQPPSFFPRTSRRPIFPHILYDISIFLPDFLFVCSRTTYIFAHVLRSCRPSLKTSPVFQFETPIRIFWMTSRNRRFRGICHAEATDLRFFLRSPHPINLPSIASPPLLRRARPRWRRPEFMEERSHLRNHDSFLPIRRWL